MLAKWAPGQWIQAEILERREQWTITKLGRRVATGEYDYDVRFADDGQEATVGLAELRLTRVRACVPVCVSRFGTCREWLRVSESCGHMLAELWTHVRAGSEAPLRDRGGAL